MPIQAPQWTDYLNCPVCCREFGPPPRSPISLGCSHTICKQCLDNLHNKQCPFDQTTIETDLEELLVNTALLQLAGYRPPIMPCHPPSIEALPENERRAYDTVVQCLEQLALYLYCSNGNNGAAGSRFSRPMQRKLVTLFQCALSDNESRVRAVRAARSLGERSVTELILQHQNSQQLSANLWAAVRARGCQFLGPAMQEEVLKLVLLALEDGSALSRKVLVMFVVQRLEPHFPQASKTSIGHVVQLLYRASCFKVSKRECDSSLMQLKDEFRTYEALRREHDAQIVQIATEAGLRIAPDQWSSLLYGDTAHKSHMQSIIDKLQTPQSFAQSIQELYIALQRTGDIAQLVAISRHLNYLANIDVNADIKIPSWEELADIVLSLKEVISCLHFNNHLTDRDGNCAGNQNGIDQAGRVINMHMMHCEDACIKDFCPRGNLCPYWHAEDHLDRVEKEPGLAKDDSTNKHAVPLAIQIPAPIPIGAIPQQMAPRLQTPQFMQPIPLPLPSHVRLAPIRLRAGVPLPPHVPLAGPMYAHYPVATTVPPKYNYVPPVAGVPMMQPNGAMMQPNGAMMQPNGAMMQPNGAMMQLNGAMMQPNGAMMQANSAMMPPNSAIMQPNGAMMQPNAAMMQPNGAMMQPNGAMMQPNGAMMQPNGAMMQPNGAMMQNPPGPLWFNPFYTGYYPHTDGNCYPAPEFVAGGVMVPPGGYHNFEASQPSAGGNAFVSPPYDLARASPYSIDGGYMEGSPDYNISPFNFHLNNVNQVQGAWSQSNNVYNFCDMRNAIDEIFAGPPTATTNNLVGTQAAADFESSDEKELEEEMQALEIRIGAVLKGSE